MHTITVDSPIAGFLQSLHGCLFVNCDNWRRLRAKALQRLFLSIEDYLRLNDVGSLEIQLAFLAAGAQGFIDENLDVPIEAASVAGMNFFKSMVTMMSNMGMRKPELSMLYAGAAATLQTHGPQLTCEVLSVLQRESAN